LWEALKPKLVYGENVRQAFEYAAGGNAEATITAWSLLHDKGGVLLPADWHQPIRQAGGVIAAGRHKDVSRRFLDFLGSSEGKKLLLKYGLFPPTPSGASDRRSP